MWLLTGTPRQNRETANIGLDSSVCRHVKLELIGSNPTLVNLIGNQGLSHAEIEEGKQDVQAWVKEEKKKKVRNQYPKLGCDP